MKRICFALLLAGASFAADAPKKAVEVKDPVCQMTVDPKTVVGMGTDAKGLLLIRQDSPAKLSVERVE